MTQNKPFFFYLVNNFFWDKFHSLITGMVRRSATVRQLRARKDPQKTAIHPFVPSLFLAKYFFACFKDSATPRPPALLLVHQLTSVPGAASRDLLLVCSSSTPRLGLANTRHVESNKVSSTRACTWSLLDPDAGLPADSFRLSVVAGVEVSSQSASHLVTFSSRAHLSAHLPCHGIPCRLASCEIRLI